MNKYRIKNNYKENIVDGLPQVVYKKAPPGDRYQISVFRYIQSHIKNSLTSIRSVIDFGCGSAYKLNKYIVPLNLEVVGVDQQFIIDEGIVRYHKIRWTADNLDQPYLGSYGKFDVIITSDVIEHLVSPEYLLDRIKAAAHHDTVIFLSTPERDLVRGYDDIGPPENPKHVREWNRKELREYLRQEGFEIVDHLILPAKSLTLREHISYLLGGIDNSTCQLVVMKYAGDS